MKTLLFERFDNFQAAPFTIQRLCELLTDPKKHYSRLDKFMRALEKNILGTHFYSIEFIVNFSFERSLYFSVVSTVEPGRKPIEPDTDNPFIEMPEIPELKKNNDALHVKHIDNGNHIDSNDPSSSTQGDNDIKKEENIEEIAVSEKSKETDEPVVKSESQIEKDIDTVKTEEPVESKPIVSVEKMDAEQEENVAKPDEVESSGNAVKTENGQIESEIKETKVEEKPTEQVVEKKEEAEVKEEPAVVETVEVEKPPTPKRRSSSDAEDVANDTEKTTNPSAKKIRLDLSDEKIDEEAKPAPEPESSDAPLVDQPIEAESDLPKETDILESISTEIDAQKESELLEDAVDSALAADKDPINIDVQPIVENVIQSEEAKPAEEIPATDDLLKADEPVATIPSELDFTPDEALNELVSSDILAVIPEQPAEEEVKMNDVENVTEPPPSSDEMNVENTENSAPEAESAMEATPIKTDEEQMDVDESNSVDAMDL